MTKISGWVFIAMGLFIGVLSWQIDLGKLLFFFLAGFIFIIYGVAKITIQFINQDNTSGKTGRIQQRPMKTNPYNVQNARYCPRCRNTVMASDNFCKRCGLKM